MGTIVEVGKAFICIVICQTAGIIGALASGPAVKGWYQTLNKPSFTPPDYVFGPVWTILFTMMGIALYLVWRQRRFSDKFGLAIFFFALQLVLNTLWSLIFFGWHSIPWALAEIIFLLAAIVITTAKFFKISRTAGWLMVPYIAWVTFAAVLNFEIWRLNH